MRLTGQTQTSVIWVSWTLSLCHSVCVLLSSLALAHVSLLHLLLAWWMQLYSKISTGVLSALISIKMNETLHYCTLAMHLSGACQLSMRAFWEQSVFFKQITIPSRLIVALHFWNRAYYTYTLLRCLDLTHHHVFFWLPCFMYQKY